MTVEPREDDAAAIDRALAGDSDAFAEIVSRYHRAVFSIAYRMTGSRAEAEDLCQDVFLRAYRSLDRFDRSLPFAPWLRRIASNAALNHLRHRAVARGAVSDAEGAEQDVPDRAAGPEERASSGETAERLGRALALLPPNQRLAFTLKYVEGLTAEEIAEAMEAPRNTVKTWLLRAREALRKELADDL